MMKTATALALALALAVSCGGPALRRDLNQAERALTKAEDVFVAWSKEQQLAIVARKLPPAEEDAAIAAFRAERDGVLLAFVLAWHALEEVWTDPTPARIQAFLAASKALGDKMRGLTPWGVKR